MVAMLISSSLTGQMVSRTGRWKVFLVFGSLSMLAGTVGLSQLQHTTPLWNAGIFMILMGLGMGSQMQNLVLAVQNAVDVHDIGAISASVAFFRMLGGAVGVSVLGAVLAVLRQDDIANGLARLGVPARQRRRARSRPDEAAPPVAESYAQRTATSPGHIFLIGAIVSLVGVVAVLFINEVPLRTTIGLNPTKATSDMAASDQDGDTEASPRSRGVT